MDALDRGMELMHLPIKEIPSLARLYLENLSRTYGFCGEVCLKAYVTYAQLSEGLLCGDAQYAASEKEIETYNTLIELYAEKKEEALTWTK